MLNLNSSFLLLAGLLVGGSTSRLVSSSALEDQAARLEALQGKVDAIQQAQWQHGLRHALADHDAAKHAIELTMARVRCSEWSAERSRVEVRGIIDSVLLDYFAAVVEYESAASQAIALTRKPKSLITQRSSEQSANAHAHAGQFETQQQTFWTSTLALAYRAADVAEETTYFESKYREHRSRQVKSDVMQRAVLTWESLEHILKPGGSEK